jgi:hypothetical protein
LDLMLIPNHYGPHKCQKYGNTKSSLMKIKLPSNILP